GGLERCERVLIGGHDYQDATCAGRVAVVRLELLDHLLRQLRGTPLYADLAGVAVDGLMNRQSAGVPEAVQNAHVELLLPRAVHAVDGARRVEDHALGADWCLQESRR